MKFFKMKTAMISILAVFLFIQNVFGQEHIDRKKCLADFEDLRSTYFKSNIDATVIQSVETRAEPLSLIHLNKGNIDYTTWKSLNNELAGYSLRQDKGFDFNQNRGFIGPLIWHQTRIWDRFFSSRVAVDNYDCSVLGRTRLAGRKVTLMRLSPQDTFGFIFVVAKDADTSLPVELSVISENHNVLAKFTVTAVHSTSTLNVAVPNETFDRIELLTNKDTDNDPIWEELVIPPNFKLVRTGTQLQEQNESIPFQMFSDGLVDFKVFKNSKTYLNIVSATEGTLSVMRKNGQLCEYAVVGEVSLEQCANILSKIR